MRSAPQVRARSGRGALAVGDFDCRRTSPRALGTRAGGGAVAPWSIPAGAVPKGRAAVRQSSHRSGAWPGLRSRGTSSVSPRRSPLRRARAARAARLAASGGYRSPFTPRGRASAEGRPLRAARRSPRARRPWRAPWRRVTGRDPRLGPRSRSRCAGRVRLSERAPGRSCAPPPVPCRPRRSSPARNPALAAGPPGRSRRSPPGCEGVSLGVRRHPSRGLGLRGRHLGRGPSGRPAFGHPARSLSWPDPPPTPGAGSSGRIAPTRKPEPASSSRARRPAPARPPPAHRRRTAGPVTAPRWAKAEAGAAARAAPLRKRRSPAPPRGAGLRGEARA